jgi:hypothetical protein
LVKLQVDQGFQAGWTCESNGILYQSQA